MVEAYKWTRTPARIGPIRFARFGDQSVTDEELERAVETDGFDLTGPDPRFSHPTVNVETEAATVTHQTLNDRSVVQQFGSKPDKISIEGVAPERDAERIDTLVETGAVTLRTERWQGKVIVESTSTDYRNEITTDGEWLVDFSISATEVTESPDDGLLDELDISENAVDAAVSDAKEAIEETANPNTVTDALDSLDET